MQWYKLSDLAAEVKAFRKCWHSKIDIIHYLDGEHSAQFLPKLRKLLGKKGPRIVATFHQPPEILNSLIRKDTIDRLDFIIVVSPEQFSYFQDFVAPGKIRLVLHGINTDYFRPGNILKEKGKFRCITVGHYLRDFRTVRKVAEALKSYKEIEFHVVSSQATGIEDLANVRIHKSVDDATLLYLYRQSDLLFLPLVQSTANNALLEGIACGLPIVSTLLPSVKAYLPGKEAILIQENNPEEFKEVILHLARNPEDCRIMALEARKRAEELDWRNIAPQYEAMYSSLMNN
jgi:glycosyltransferase involved in cell wall biosynthesis